MHLDECLAMTTAEEITMKHSHFRLKVDLSRYFQDVRRFCWIFIDGTKIQQVIHMQHHISKLFNITEPFHLVLNETEYLPPIEDVRILKENETILVVPGSGINHEVSTLVETSNGFIHDKKVQTNIKTGKQEIIAQNTSNDIFNNTQPTPISNVTRDTFYSIINDTTVEVPSEGDTGSKISTETNVTEDCNMRDSIVSVTKRKRVRRRKPKNRSQIVVSPETIEENISKEPKLKKPKIIDSYIIPSRKHIRFDDVESENNIAKQIVQEVSKNESNLSKGSSCRDLSTLLALGQSSTPITFVNKKLKNLIKTESVLNDEKRSKNLNKIMEANMEKKLYTKEAKEKAQGHKMQFDLEKLPIMDRKPRVNEIVAFKKLKIGEDYTPQVSKFLLTEVLAVHESTGDYTFRIFSGKEEIQAPFGKFSLSEDESESLDGDTFILNSSEMLEPRLVTCFVS